MDPSDAPAAPPIKVDEATWRTRDLRKSVDGFTRDFLAREIALGTSTGQRMAKTLKTVQATKAGIGKAHEQLDALTAKLAGTKQRVAGKFS